MQPIVTAMSSDAPQGLCEKLQRWLQQQCNTYRGLTACVCAAVAAEVVRRCSMDDKTCASGVACNVSFVLRQELHWDKKQAERIKRDWINLLQRAIGVYHSLRCGVVSTADASMSTADASTVAATTPGPHRSTLPVAPLCVHGGARVLPCASVPNIPNADVQGCPSICGKCTHPKPCLPSVHMVCPINMFGSCV